MFLNFNKKTLKKHFLHLWLCVDVCSSVDYEEQPVRLRLIDVNDEVPQFQNVPHPFLAMVSSDAPLGTSVYQLMANDLDQDSLVRYSLESGKHKPNCYCFVFACVLLVAYSVTSRPTKCFLRPFPCPDCFFVQLFKE